ncbi:hypothetical protein PGIGA_G00074220 [Pangasianodon gigas]|uniref:Uncharacterized protein n=1 Tax=Pangasianodon gigas TaxID=30993 RepID=A0ACC5X954_PANGG|nr:hypothetical protein [Pangasianodon gigas]
MSAELAGQSARAFLPFLPNSDLEGDNKRGSERAPGASRATGSLLQVCVRTSPAARSVYCTQGLDGKMHVWIPDQMEASTWRLKQSRWMERWKGLCCPLLRASSLRTSSRLFCVTENPNKWRPVYTADVISDYKSESDA